MARYLRKVTDGTITIVPDDDDQTWDTLLAQRTAGDDDNSPKPLYEQTSEAAAVAAGASPSSGGSDVLSAIWSSLPATEEYPTFDGPLTLGPITFDPSKHGGSGQYGAFAMEAGHIAAVSLRVHFITVSANCILQTSLINDADFNVADVILPTLAANNDSRNIAGIWDTTEDGGQGQYGADHMSVEIDPSTGTYSAYVSVQIAVLK